MGIPLNGHGHGYPRKVEPMIYMLRQLRRMDVESRHRWMPPTALQQALRHGKSGCFSSAPALGTDSFVASTPRLLTSG
eukprot:3403658-Alexandrium_andersonii.AAC.1